jgi:hypothetical protein
MVDAAGPEQLLADFDIWDWKPDIMIVETFRKVLVGDENHAPDVAAFWRSLNPLIEAGITLEFISIKPSVAMVGHARESYAMHSRLP